MFRVLFQSTRASTLCYQDLMAAGANTICLWPGELEDPYILWEKFSSVKLPYRAVILILGLVPSGADTFNRPSNAPGLRNAVELRTWTQRFASAMKSLNEDGWNIPVYVMPFDERVNRQTVNYHRYMHEWAHAIQGGDITTLATYATDELPDDLIEDAARDIDQWFFAYDGRRDRYSLIEQRKPTMLKWVYVRPDRKHPGDCWHLHTDKGLGCVGFFDWKALNSNPEFMKSWLAGLKERSY